MGPGLPGPVSQRGCNTAGQVLVRPGPSGGNRRLLNRVGREAGSHQASRPRSKCHLLSRSLEKHPSGRAREGPAEARCGGQARRALGRPGAGPRPPEQIALLTHGNWSGPPTPKPIWLQRPPTLVRGRGRSPAPLCGAGRLAWLGTLRMSVSQQRDWCGIHVTSSLRVSSAPFRVFSVFTNTGGRHPGQV